MKKTMITAFASLVVLTVLFVMVHSTIARSMDTFTTTLTTGTNPNRPETSSQVEESFFDRGVNGLGGFLSGVFGRNGR